MKSSKTGKVFGGLYTGLYLPQIYSRVKGVLLCAVSWSENRRYFISRCLCFLTSTFDYNETLVPIIFMRPCPMLHGLLSRDIVLR